MARWGLRSENRKPVNEAERAYLKAFSVSWAPGLSLECGRVRPDHTAKSGKDGHQPSATLGPID